MTGSVAGGPVMTAGGPLMVAGGLVVMARGRRKVVEVVENCNLQRC